MKTIRQIIAVTIALCMGTVALTAQQDNAKYENEPQRICFEGYVSQGEGIAGWNADGSGPEPAAYGHVVPSPGFGHHYYYGSSHDFITGDSRNAGFHFLPNMSGFTNFEKALINYGFSANQVKVKMDVTSLGDDLEGLDWFFIKKISYANYYDIKLTFEVAGTPMLEGSLDYANMHINTAGGNWQVVSGFTPLRNIAQNETSAYEVARAFLSDLKGKEIQISFIATYEKNFSGNGRFGSYYNVQKGVLAAGYPKLDFTGLNQNNEGFAVWDANGYGPEPYGDGHYDQPYYRASMDYGGINPLNDAALGHFVDGSKGFFNTLIQLKYRGYAIDDLKIKMGLSSLGPDVYGEDWGYDKAQHWCNYYNNSYVIELKGVPILQIMQDKDYLVEGIINTMSSKATFGKAYAISTRSEDHRCVTKSFLKDLGNHLLISKFDDIRVVETSSFMGNGRNGKLWEIVKGSFIGVHEAGTFIPEGEVSGIWAKDNSPFYVDGNLKVNAGQTLVIEAGSEIIMRGPYSFKVEGRILAKGDCGKEIIFTRSNPNVWWDGFDYYDTHSTLPSIFNQCIFEYSSAQGGGSLHSGGVFAVSNYDELEIYCCVFRNNKADKSISPGGGAIALRNSSPMIQRCTFYHNFSKYGGAIMAYDNSHPVISNCLFYENKASFGGAIAIHTYSGGIVINNTIADNKAINGGGLYFANHSAGEIINNIIWNNKALAFGNQVSFQGYSNLPGFYYNDCQGGETNFGGHFEGNYKFNIDKNPMFKTNPNAHPYSISRISPCINAGTPPTAIWYYQQYLPAFCPCGTARVCNGCIDIGAYEVNVCTGIIIEDPPHEKSAEISSVNAYPNPFVETVNVGFDLPEAGNVTVEVYNSIGKLMLPAESVYLTAGSQQITRNLSSLPDGIYLLMIKYNDTVLTRKLLKAR